MDDETQREQKQGYPEGHRRIAFVSVEEVDAAGGPWKYFR